MDKEEGEEQEEGEKQEKEEEVVLEVKEGKRLPKYIRKPIDPYKAI